MPECPDCGADILESPHDLSVCPSCLPNCPQQTVIRESAEEHSKSDTGKQFSHSFDTRDWPSKISVRTVSIPTQDDADQASQADYKIVRELWRVDCGTLWLAIQASTQSEVALRRQVIPDPSVPKDLHPVIRNNFLHEVLVLGELNHPNIPQVYDLWCDAEQQLYYTTKVLRGTSWDLLIKSYSVADNIKILQRVSSAVGFCHSRGVVHRDLKPANVIISSYGEITLQAFQFALLMDRFPRQIPRPQIPTRVGTPAYMPPEQASGNLANTGPRSDVYLLGAILFQIVTGVPPHPIEDDGGEAFERAELLNNAIENRIVETKASGELFDIAMKAMATKPADRYIDVAAFERAIEEYVRHEESRAIADNAEKKLESATSSKDYRDFLGAISGFENALLKWPENQVAEAGLRRAKVRFGNETFKNADYRLGLSYIDANDPDCEAVHWRLISAERNRHEMSRRLRILRLISALLVCIFVCLVVAASWIVSETRATVAQERKRALAALELALEEREAALRKVEEITHVAAKQEMLAKKTLLQTQAQAMIAVQLEREVRDSLIIAQEEIERLKQQLEKEQLRSENK